MSWGRPIRNFIHAIYWISSFHGNFTLRSLKWMFRQVGETNFSRAWVQWKSVNSRDISTRKKACVRFITPKAELTFHNFYHDWLFPFISSLGLFQKRPYSISCLNFNSSCFKKLQFHESRSWAPQAPQEISFLMSTAIIQPWAFTKTRITMC